jgi:hypothetical protein
MFYRGEMAMHRPSVICIVASANAASTRKYLDIKVVNMP